MTAKENLLAMYGHKKIEIMPVFGEGEFCVYPVNGFHERPPHNEGGRDWFGCLWEYCDSAMAPAPDPREHVLEDICGWRELVKFPDLDAWDWEKAAREDHVADADRENQMVNVVVLIGLFERLHVLMGFEEALCALVTDPEEVAAFFDAMTDFKIKLIGKLAQYYKPDLITFHDDWGTQRGPFFAPELWRRLIKPRMKRIIDAAHGHGILFLMHSCGKYDEIVPDIAEIGVDTLQCMDIMDIGKLLEEDSGRMSFQVSVHSQDFESRDGAGILTDEIVRGTVEKEFREWGGTGRYFPCIFPPSKWYEKTVYETFIKVREELAGTYTR